MRTLKELEALQKTEEKEDALEQLKVFILGTIKEMRAQCEKQEYTDIDDILLNGMRTIEVAVKLTPQQEHQQEEQQTTDDKFKELEKTMDTAINKLHSLLPGYNECEACFYENVEYDKQPCDTCSVNVCNKTQSSNWIPKQPKPSALEWEPYDVPENLNEVQAVTGRLDRIEDGITLIINYLKGEKG